MQYRTDLAMEQTLHRTGAGVSQRQENLGGVQKTEVIVETEEAAAFLGKPRGHYITFSMESMVYADGKERMHLSRLVAETLKSLLPGEGEVLVVGLGNRRITADALGSRVLDDLLITRHLQGKGAQEKLPLRSVCALAPGVLGVTGMETAEVIRGIVHNVKPGAVIAIDALAARECSRIGNTIQLTDTGILPGSGVGNHRMGLNEETLGVKVIAIGVPMVVYAAVIARDALQMMMQEMGMKEEEHEGAMDALMERTLHQTLMDMVVTPREVDEMVGKLARIISDGINMALQPGLSYEEMMVLSHDGL
ncbi:MAG: GPR endopeptidase [Clostridia bacterium]|nr:GPR endopeptidase [Clostridia bacterium]